MAMNQKSMGIYGKKIVEAHHKIMGNDQYIVGNHVMTK